MKRLLFLILLMGLGVAVVFLSGCGDDDKGTGSTEKATGDTLDPLYLVAAEGFGVVSDATPQFIEKVLETTFFFLYDTSATVAGKGPLGVTIPADELDTIIYDSLLTEYHNDSKYWYFYVSFTEIAKTGDNVEDSSEIVTEDSIQFLHGETPVQWPDSAELTGIKVGGYVSNYSLLHPDTMVFSLNFTMLGDIPALGDVVGNGSGQAKAAGDFEDDSLGFCHGSLTVTETIDNVAFNLGILSGDGCPSSGTVRYSGPFEFECVDGADISYSDTWTVTQNFTGVITTTRIENTTTVWTTYDTCDTGP